MILYGLNYMMILFSLCLSLVSGTEEAWLRLQCEVLNLQLQSKDIEIRILKEDIVRFESSVASLNQVVRAAERNIVYLNNKVEQQKAIIRREVRSASWS
jgi:hypothetical protein